MKRWGGMNPFRQISLKILRSVWLCYQVWQGLGREKVGWDEPFPTPLTKYVSVWLCYLIWQGLSREKMGWDEPLLTTLTKYVRSVWLCYPIWQGLGRDWDGTNPSQQLSRDMLYYFYRVMFNILIIK